MIRPQVCLPGDVAPGRNSPIIRAAPIASTVKLRGPGLRRWTAWRDRAEPGRFVTVGEGVGQPSGRVC